MDSFFQRLTQGLTKTKEGWVRKLESVFHARRWDEEALTAVEEILLSADVGVKATQRLIETLRRESPKGDQETMQDLSLCLQREMVTMLKESGRTAELPRLTESPWVILFLGANGVGKTTTIGKMAAQYRQRGRKVLLVAADTFRAAAIEQLEVWSQRAGSELVKHQAGADPSAVVFDGLHAAKKRKADVVLVDTAGRLHNKVHLVEELKKIRRVVAREQAGAPQETLLVLDATTGQNAFQQARVFREALGITGIVLTKLDGTAKGGVVVGIQADLGIPVQYIGIGEGIEDLQPFDPTRFVQALFA
jgi:fused signal recognition particle receptor